VHPNGLPFYNNPQHSFVPLHKDSQPGRKVAAGRKNNIGSLFRTFLMSKSAWQKMISHCTEELPLEACGLLSGKNGVAETVWPMENIKRSPVSFSMDIEQIRSVFELIDKKDECLIGIYHSHPTGSAYPSAGDIAYNNYPEVGHLIVSLANKTPIVNCFQIKGKQVTPLSIQLVRRQQ
jgi:[CysO sulfur-carrier protein]-S-L-cysteine hydrolase